ncbi:MAG: Ig-like domain-containing protein, partial [Rhodanobacteraceae bacterium]
LNVAQPPNGSVTISGTTLIYTPNPGFSGVDRFSYTVSDGHGGTSTAVVTITVTLQTPPPNRVPVALNDTAATAFGVPVNINVLANDSDADRDPLAITGVSAPANGTASVAGNAVTYTPAAGFSGTDTFTYSISDGRGGTASASVSVTVAPQPNRPPVAVDDAATTAFGTAVAINVLANDTDPDGDPLAISGVTTPANGSVSASGGTITYTPANGFSGTDRFTYTIDDGRGGTASANVTVTVGARPNQPPVANDDAATTVAPAPVTINVLTNDSDPDGDPLTLQSVTQPASGSAAISGTVVVYTPAAGFVGTDTFDYTINDGRGGTATATVTVTITPPPNAPPVAVDDATTTAFATPVTIDAIANDSDPDGDALTIISVTTPIGGTATIANNRIDYVPSRAFTGLDTFSYTISDGHGHTTSANISVDVLPIPRPR